MSLLLTAPVDAWFAALLVAAAYGSATAIERWRTADERKAMAEERAFYDVVLGTASPARPTQAASVDVDPVVETEEEPAPGPDTETPTGEPVAARRLSLAEDWRDRSGEIPVPQFGAPLAPPIYPVHEEARPDTAIVTEAPSQPHANAARVNVAPFVGVTQAWNTILAQPVGDLTIPAVDQPHWDRINPADIDPGLLSKFRHLVHPTVVGRATVPDSMSPTEPPADPGTGPAPAPAEPGEPKAADKTGNKPRRRRRNRRRGGRR